MNGTVKYLGQADGKWLGVPACVGSQIKAQAKKNAPEVIHKAGAAVLPRFEQIVDDFQARLIDFVTAAGDALHRGISEVLDRALAGL